MIPQLRFSVVGASAELYAAVPTISFDLRIEAAGEQQISSILLDIQLQIAARQRGYEAAEQDRLLELFGSPERWASTLRTLPWLRTTLVVPPFSGSTEIKLPVQCSYDLEVAGARYFAALEDGEVPVELLFSGSVFYTGPQGMLQTSRIGLDQEVDYRLPVAVWRQAIDRHFPASAWLRLGTESFNRLSAYKARGAFASWDAAVDSLLAE
jgi:hypothetical protein